MNKGDQPAESESRALLRGTAVTSALTLLSRILGFFRDLILARLLGASPIADAFFVAFRLPNMLRSFVGEGAMTAAFVPTITHEFERNPTEARHTFRATLTLLLITSICLSALGIAYAAEIIGWIAPGFTQSGSDNFELCITLSRIMLPYIIFVSLVALIGGALSTQKIFGAQAYAQILMNVTLIAAALLALMVDLNVALFWLAGSVVIGGVVQVAAQLPALRSCNLSLLPTATLLTPGTREILRLLPPALLGGAVYQIGIFISTVLASLVGPGAVSWLYYADRITQLPLGIFSVALASVLLPALSRSQAKKDAAQFSQSLLDSLRHTTFVILPCCGALLVLATPLTRLLFERGSFTSEDTSATALAIMAIAPGLWASSCHSMLVRSFLAQKDTTTTMRIGVVTLLISTISAIYLMGPIAPEQRSPVGQAVAWLQSIIGTGADLGHVGLALSSSLGAAASLLMSSVLFARKYPAFPWSHLATTIVKTLTATAIAAAGAFLIGVSGFSLFLQIIGFTVLFTLCTFLLKQRESRETISLLGRYRRQRH